MSAGNWCIWSLCFAAASAAQAQEPWNDQLSRAVTDGKASLDLRYRYEWVDQDRFDKNAKASLLRSRITLESASLHGFTALIEADNVTSIGADDYNSTENGKTEFPVIADPEYTEINQAWLKYTGNDWNAIAGRQRILHLNQRFVGGVAWRQNEQTYDGARLEVQPLDSLTLDASYVYNVNRVFGPEDGANPGDLEGDNVLLLANYQLGDSHRISGYGYLLDFDEDEDFAPSKSVNLSSNTFGLEYGGKFDVLAFRAAYALQSDAGDSELDYDTDYYVVEASAVFSDLKIQGTYEVLAADNGVGFATPLATAHGFLGWADKFLTTPDDGVEDLSLSVSGKLGPVSLAAIYHDFQAESSSEDFGSEIDLVATWPVNEQLTVQAKYASFNTDSPDRYDDTDKAWFTLQLKLP